MRVGADKLTRRHPLFGQVLLSQGKIEVEQLDEAVRRQLETKIYIGEILIQMGAIASEDIVNALDIQRTYYPEEGRA